MNGRIFSRLLWKDYRIVRMLGVAACCASVGMMVLLELSAAMNNLHDQEVANLARAIWVFVPFLVAFGAPAMLVGMEEESGSLKWLGTLPANWKMVTTSKFVVGLACLLASWAIATTLLMISYQLHSIQLDFRISTRANLIDGDMSAAIAFIATSLLMLICSFVTAYFFRSPIAGLIAFLPTIFGCLWGLVNWFDFQTGPQHSTPLTTEHLPLLIVDSVGLAMIVFTLMYFLAWRRLTWAQRKWSLKRSSKRSEFSSVANAYRPPHEPSRLAQAVIPKVPPTRFGALLWQSLRPTRWYFLLAIAAISWVAAQGFFYVSNSRNLSIHPATFLIASTVLFFVAGLTFYSDSLRGRNAFFFDRGISPKLVWVTRVLPSFVIVHLLFAAMMVLMFLDQSLLLPWKWAATYGIGLSAYAMAVMFSQSTSRPLLNFFAGPVAVYFSAILLGLCLFEYFAEAMGLLIISAIILLYGSYRLTDLWMQQQTRNRRYILRQSKYIAAALFAPFLIVFVVRWATLPPRDSSWRHEMETVQLPSRSSLESIWINPNLLYNSTLTPSNDYFDSREEASQKISAELAAKSSIGEHVTFNEIASCFTNEAIFYGLRQDTLAITWLEAPDSANYELQLDCIRVLSKWSKLIRERAVVGQADLTTLLSIAEQADLFSCEALQMFVSRDGARPELQEIIDGLPDEYLVQQSRRNAMIRNWRGPLEKQSQRWMPRPQTPTAFWMYLEQVRSKRAIDRITQIALNQIEFDAQIDTQAVEDLMKDAYIVVDHRTDTFVMTSTTKWLERFQTVNFWMKHLRQQSRDAKDAAGLSVE
ncbi:ABC-2 transporter permease [Rhodopirellula sp. MGV]|uniref:ABC-2 transporter permease n=1 Tax=Rhodopirellula sp. MGV TaxID=2023130 RepID=UPI000B95F7D2|nr:ABC-2 transporter permease [Rhodopirellula sp. MGV]OYP34968.1 hypothetical protein CGZ80_13185 [Rhodopirellula sp. MGV]PNY38136.1 ABC-2 transporter permease [Rhodopirellula baltica]